MVKKSETYEDLLVKLEGILSDMENKNLTLEEAMKNYEEGMKLYNKLQQTLQKAEAKIKILKNNKEESFEEYS